MEGNMKRVKKGILYISIIMLMFSMIITEPVPVHAYINVPSTVRVGIYYVNSYQNTTVTSFTASASGGINVGVNISGSYYPLYEHYGSDNLSVFLDSPGSKYFVRIGGVYSDRNSAVSVLNICKANGLPAYLVFDNNWQVWAGCFNDAASASNAATGTYASKTGGQPVTVVTSPVRDLRVTRSEICV
jgi:hypothetical protein